MSRFKVKSIDLTEEQFLELQRIEQSGDDAALLAEIERLTGDRVEDIEMMRLQEINVPPTPPLDATLRIAHSLMHAKEQELLEAFLCVSVAMLDGERVPREVMLALQAKLNAFGIKLHKAGCAGTA